MEILFLLLGFLFFVKGCTGLTLPGKVGGTVVFQCNSSKKEIKSISFQGGPGFKTVKIQYYAPTNETKIFRLDTVLNLVDKTITFKNLTVSDEGKYKCVIFYGEARGKTEDTITTLNITATPDAVTLDHHSPESPGDVSNASLTCTAIAVYPVSNISWNVSGVLEHQWKNVVKQDKNSSLFNISSTAFFNCSDGSTRLIRCFLGGVSSDEKIVCQQPKGVPIGTSLLIIVPVVFLAGVTVVALCCDWKPKRNSPGPPMPEQDNVQDVELQVFRPRTDETPIRQQSAAMGTIGTTAEKETDETDILLTTGT
ncbi:cell adhesion molecule 3-like isoform X1 [Gadus morhua]|uniref:cell adhesion molecule 3-like isoform X1 n=1 Tax=Gadus morhua TaxID=8049 RepID=UPI0011B5162E|nr:cell adhesion molecule 3-like isoform X1 [Gadus morhua]